MVRSSMGSQVRLAVMVPVTALALAAAMPAFAKEAVPAPYDDRAEAVPGTRHLIRPADMPAPFASAAVANPAKVVARPKRAWPLVPDGFVVSAFATGLKGARQMAVAPNGDVFVAQSTEGRISILRTMAGAQQALGGSTFVEELERPFGIAFYPPGPDPRFVYVATEASIVRYPYRVGDKVAAGEAETIVSDLPSGGHWTRNIVFSPDGGKLYIAVGSGSNDAEGGMDLETNRADILECDPDGGNLRVFASGIRNPVGLAFHPRTGALWAAVNERDGLGDDLPPDYVTEIAAGGFYGWPWDYIGDHPDPTHQGEQFATPGAVIVPEVLVQPHSAPLGLAVYEGTSFPPGYRDDIFVALHGSWNRAHRTGYKVIRVRTEAGRPTGAYEDFMTGFALPKDKVWGRPVGIAVAGDGALLVSDDESGTVWRVAFGSKDAKSGHKPLLKRLLKLGGH
jgi:glucose/arabinose dehydrogenase